MKTKLLVLIMLLFGIYNLQAQQIEQSKEKQESTQVQKDNVSDKPTDEEAARYTRIALIIAGVILFLKWKYSGTCKKCKRYRAMKTYDKDLVGTMKTKRVQQGNDYVNEYTRRYKIYRQCKYCGYKDSIFKDKTER